jgi:hypothetical protein
MTPSLWDKQTATEELTSLLKDAKADGKYPAAVSAIKELNALHQLSDSSNSNGKLARKINIKINSLGLPPIAPEPEGLVEGLVEPSIEPSVEPSVELPSITYPKE